MSGIGGDGRRAHHPADRPVEYFGAMVAQAIDHVAFRHDAGDPPALDHRQRADPLLAQPAHGLADGVAAIVSTALPLPRSTDAMVIRPPDDSPLVA